MSRRILAVAAAAALTGCGGGVGLVADHEGGVVRYSQSGGEHEKAISTASTHCRRQGFTSYSITREYVEGDRGGIDFKCRN
jgi:hypothetical protein